MARQQANPSFVLEFFQEELNSDNVHHRLFAANNIQLIAAAMGPEHARTDLMNYLLQANQLDGEVQMSLASCLGNLVKYIGGNEYAHILLGPLRVLAGAEEAIVRDKAIESMGIVCDCIPQANADSNLLQAAQLLASNDFFTSRASACAFIVKIYSKVSEPNKTNLRGYFKSLAEDETPMVRRSALKNLPELCKMLPPPILINEIARGILAKSVNDDEDSVRLLLPKSLSVVSGKLSEAERGQLIIYLCKIIVKDGSWRVRSELANELPTIAKPFAVEAVMNDIWSLLQRLLKDPEAETKTSACKAVSGILPLLKGQSSFVADKMIKEYTALANDGAPQVRREVSLHLMEFAPIIGNQATLSSLVPVFIKILGENDNDASVALLSSLLNHADEIDLPTITPAILEVILRISGDAKWRVKVAIVKLIPHFARVLGIDEFTAKLFPLVKMWLSDDMFSVRENMTNQLPALVHLFGADWAIKQLVPVVISFQGNQSYLIRQVTLMCVAKLKDVLPQNVLTEQFFKTVIKMASDKIPNIKFMVAKTLLLFMGNSDPKVNSQIQQCLRTLASDPDTDVKFYACNASLKCT